MASIALLRKIWHELWICECAFSSDRNKNKDFSRLYDIAVAHPFSFYAYLYEAIVNRTENFNIISFIFDNRNSWADYLADSLVKKASRRGMPMVRPMICSKCEENQVRFVCIPQFSPVYQTWEPINTQNAGPFVCRKSS